MQLRHFEAAQITLGDRWGKRRAREPSSTRPYWQVRGHALLEVGGRRVQLESGDLARVAVLGTPLGHIGRATGESPARFRARAAICKEQRTWRT
ncbi:cupin domain-containing protein [Pendulispora brunnea]|uniref:Cupin domain-containing protein n=1 Tax=Pendulispora brunnea TaxID=2905690 RepID=A0ABZ2KH77_9BACT